MRHGGPRAAGARTGACRCPAQAPRGSPFAGLAYGGDTERCSGGAPRSKPSSQLPQGLRLASPTRRRTLSHQRAATPWPRAVPGAQRTCRFKSVAAACRRRLVVVCPHGGRPCVPTAPSTLWKRSPCRAQVSSRASATRLPRSPALGLTPAAVGASQTRTTVAMTAHPHLSSSERD